MCSRWATQFHGGPITFKLQNIIQAPASHLVSPQSINENVRTMWLEVYRSQMCPYPLSTCLPKLCTAMTWCLVVARGVLTCRLCGFGNYIMETLSPNAQLWAKPNILTLMVAKHSKILKSVQKIRSPLKVSIDASMCVVDCY
jgi:hypothetical protein